MSFDPLTSHGLTFALGSGLHASDALLGPGRPAVIGYERARRTHGARCGRRLAARYAPCRHAREPFYRARGRATPWEVG